jgi:hypothetical protein
MPARLHALMLWWLSSILKGSDVPATRQVMLGRCRMFCRPFCTLAGLLGECVVRTPVHSTRAAITPA